MVSPKKAKPRRPKGLGTNRKRADGTWEARVSWYEPDGRRKYRSAIRETKTLAEVALSELRTKYRPGALDRAEDQTFRLFLHDWLSAKEPAWAASTYRTQATYVEHHILGEHGHLGDLKVRDITVDDIDTFMRELAKQGVGDPTRAGVLTTISGALQYAVDKGRLAANPARNADKVKTPKESSRGSLTMDQTKRLLRVLHKNPLGSLVRFLLDTGVREGEAFALSWDDVDLTEGSVDIRYSLSRDKDRKFIRKSTKSGNSRIVYLEPETVAALRDHVTHTNAKWHLVWTTRDGAPLDKDNFGKRVMKPLFRSAHLPVGTVVHTLRHTSASLQLASGTDLLTVKYRGGWKDTRMLTEIYGHYQAEKQKDGVAKVGREKSGFIEPQFDYLGLPLVKRGKPNR